MKQNRSFMLRAVPAALAVIVSPTVAGGTGGAGTGNLLDGAVYTQLNTLNGPNEAVAYARGPDGHLTEVGRYATGGMGDDKGLIPSGQDPVLLTVDPANSAIQHLFVVNPGGTGADPNGTVSVFRVESDRLVLTDTESARGIGTRSVTRRGNVVYVVNGGTGEFVFGDGPGAPDPVAAGQPLVANPVSANISGYTFDAGAGTLTPIAGAVADLDDPFGDPAQISFDNNGEFVVITQRHTTFALITGLEPDNVETFRINGDGTIAEGPIVSPVTGNDTFGFRFDARNNNVIMTHGNGQVVNGGGVSVARLNADGTLTTLIPNLPNGASDTCWNVLTYRTDPPTMYTNAAFDSEITIQGVNANGTIADGGLGIGPMGPFQTPARRAVAAPRQAGDGLSLTEGRYLADNGGFDIALTENGTSQFLYAVWNQVQIPVSAVSPHGTIVPFRVELDDDGIDNGTLAAGDLRRLDGFRITGLPSTFFGLAAW